MSEIIKELIRKTASDNYVHYPLGADAQYINMASLLDLQEQLKLGGGNKQITIEENNSEAEEPETESSFQITQSYQDNHGTELYRVITTIETKNQAWIVDHSSDQNEDIHIIIGKDGVHQDGNSILNGENEVIIEDISGLTSSLNTSATLYNLDRIKMQLYKVSNSELSLLHTKTLYINIDTGKIIQEVS